MTIYGVYTNPVQFRSPDGKRQVYIMNDRYWIRNLPPPIGDSGWEEIGKNECENILAGWAAP